MLTPKWTPPGRPACPFWMPPPTPGLAGLDARLSQCDVVIDAILGAGRYRPPAGVVAAAIALVNRRRRANDGYGWRIIALDLPTGVHPDTGVAAADSIVADSTLALCCPKWGIAGFPGAGYAGRISVLDIGLPPAAMGAVGDMADWMTPSLAAGLLPARPLDGHKGTFGHLLVIAGSRNYVGAAALACRAAHRVGAGLVTLAAPASIYPILAAKLDETIHLPLPEDAEGRVAADAAGVIRGRMGAYSALAVGCGMGQSGGAVEFMRRLLRSVNDREGGGRGDNDNRAARLPAVIDADGLNNLARNPDWPGLLGAAGRTDAPSRRDGNPHRAGDSGDTGRPAGCGSALRRRLGANRPAQGRLQHRNRSPTAGSAFCLSPIRRWPPGGPAMC